MYIVPTFETGPNKGGAIMLACDAGKRWADANNNIFVDREHDADWNYLDTFRVAERLRGNTHTVWTTGRSFDDAMDLACRLVVGDTYLPPKRAAPVENVPYFEYEVGDILPGRFHLHQINDPAFGKLFTYDDDSRMEINEAMYTALVKSVSKISLSNKSACIVSIDDDCDDDGIPEKMMIVYLYDDRYYSAILRKKESLIDFYNKHGMT